MKTDLYSNINISVIYGLSILRKQINIGITDKSVGNMQIKDIKIGLEAKRSVKSEKLNKNLQTIKILSDKIISINKSQLNLWDKNQSNLIISKLNNINNNNKGLTNTNLNESKLIIMNAQQYINLISPFNINLANVSNHIYTFTNKYYKEINKNLNNLYTICNSAFLNMSSIISKPIISIYPKFFKFTFFYYWKPLKNEYYYSNLHSKFLILHYNQLENLIKIFTKLFKKSVELELIRIYSPQNESNILANLIGILSNFIKFRYIHMKLLKVSKIKNINKRFNNRFLNNKIPSFLSGISLKLAGKVLTQKIQKRVKSKVIQLGSLARTKATIVNTNRFVNKNKRGTFSITLKTGHIFND